VRRIGLHQQGHLRGIRKGLISPGGPRRRNHRPIASRRYYHTVHNPFGEGERLPIQVRCDTTRRRSRKVTSFVAILASDGQGSRAARHYWRRKRPFAASACGPHGRSADDPPFGLAGQQLDHVRIRLSPFRHLSPRRRTRLDRTNGRASAMAFSPAVESATISHGEPPGDDRGELVAERRAAVAQPRGEAFGDHRRLRGVTRHDPEATTARWPQRSRPVPSYRARRSR
jgi:hypothetical protein